MAMLPFCGYNMADYWAHWLKIGKHKGAKLPRLYYVNWFRKGEDGDFLWPGYSENSRVLKWIFERIEGTAKAIETPIGNLPTPHAIDTSGLSDVTPEDLATLLRVEAEGWLTEVPMIEEYYAQFGDRMPRELLGELRALKEELRSRHR
jgi:phosphoenolpyruvate carboxykinase (GTP)